MSDPILMLNGERLSAEEMEIIRRALMPLADCYTQPFSVAVSRLLKRLTAPADPIGAPTPPVYAHSPCCEAMRRLESTPGDATTLRGWWCPIHGTRLTVAPGEQRRPWKAWCSGLGVTEQRPWGSLRKDFSPQAVAGQLVMEVLGSCGGDGAYVVVVEHPDGARWTVPVQKRGAVIEWGEAEAIPAQPAAAGGGR